MSNYEHYCQLCGRSDEKAGSLISIPGGIRVCQDCINKAMKMAESMTFMHKMPSPYDINNDASDSSDKKEDEKSEVVEAEDNLEEADTQTESPDKEDKEPEKKADDPKKDSDRGMGRFPGGFGFPNISFMNMSDFQNMMMGNQPARKKDKKKKEKPAIDISNIPLPHEIKKKLDEYVVGQDQAKRVMSVAVYNHYKRIVSESMKTEEFEEDLRNVEIEKSNVLLIGPTGCGKTYLVRTLAKLLDVPLAITDATSLTEAGYIGDDIESVVSKLLAAADNDVDKAETGIIFIDEIDKIAKKKNTHARDVSGESVQQGMLKLLEGSEVEVPIGANSKNAMVPLATVDTRNILFVCGGAFPELDEIIKQRLRNQTSIGFNAELKDVLDKKKDVLKEVEVEDIKKFGMIPEFVGRLPIIATMEGLTEDMLVDILKEPKNAIIKQYQKLLSIDEVKLEFDDEALRAIAKKAMKKDTGARALRSIIEDIMLDIMYEIPKDDSIGRVTITKDYIEGTGGPVIDLRGGTLSFSERDKIAQNQSETGSSDSDACEDEAVTTDESSDNA